MHWVADSSSLMTADQVGCVLFACSCQTHGVVELSLPPGGLLGKSSSVLWRRLKKPHLHNQEVHNQNPKRHVYGMTSLQAAKHANSHDTMIWKDQHQKAAFVSAT